MSDELIDQADPAVDDAAEQSQDHAEGANDELELELEQDEQEPAGELADVEFDGKQYKVPPELKQALMLQADYTRKTQEVADQRRAFEAEQAEFQQRTQRQQQNIQQYGQLAAIDGQLQKFQQVDWNALSQEDPVQAQQLWFQFQTLRDNRGALAQHLQQAEQQAALEMQQATAKRLEEGQRALAAEIKNWSPETKQQLKDYGKRIGASEQDLSGVNSPWIVRALHKAMQYDQLVDKARQKPKGDAPTAPVSTVKPNGSAPTRPSDKMSTKDWMAAEQKRLADRNRKR